MLSVSHIETVFKKNLQRDITISLNKKILKQGRLTLFALKGFYLNLKLITPAKKFILVELPFPFSVIDSQSTISLSYKPCDCGIDAETIRRLLAANTSFRKTSKLLNSEILISVV